MLFLYFIQTFTTPKCHIGSSDVYYADSRHNKPGQFLSVFVNVRNCAVTTTVIKPQPGNDLIASTPPELRGGFTKNRTDGGTNLAVNFTVLPYRRDLMNNLQLTQCESRVWIARKLKKLSGFCWVSRNDLGQHHSGSRAFTLLIATINQSNPRAQYRLDSLFN